jgi:hypothetical protein
MPHKFIGVASLLVLLAGTAGCRKNATEPDPVIPELPAVDPQTVLLFDNFDAENGGAGVLNWKGWTNWNVASGCVDLVGNGLYDVQRNNGLYMDLDGTCQSAGTVETKTEFSLAPGSYVLEFWLAGNQRFESSDTVVVSLGSLLNERIVMGNSEPFRLFTRPVSVASQTAARLRFAHAGGDDRGVLLDQLRLRRSN